MLDGWARGKIEPFVSAAGARLAASGVAANTVTIGSFVVGLLAVLCIADGWMLAGALLILLSRLGDALDGVVARTRGKTDFGGFLDLTLDFAFYGAVPLAFAIVDPEANALAAAALIAAFYANGATFLGYAIIAAKRGHSTDVRGDKSVYFTTGLAEASETLAVFVAFCLFPQWFAPIAWGFAVLCLWTAFWRVIQARRAFADR